MMTTNLTSISLTDESKKPIITVSDYDGLKIVGIRRWFDQAGNQ